MKRYTISIIIISLVCLSVFAQKGERLTDRNGPEGRAGLIRQVGEISREKREAAYAKLLEGQRHLWELARFNSDPLDRSKEALKIRRERLAKAAFQMAVELNPRLAEGYTALAELALVSKNGNIEDAIMFARIAVRLDKTNFGSHLYLARLYTIKSNIGRGRLNEGFAKGAIEEWNMIAKLDPRNAEAHAFLSAFYAETKQPEKRLDALRKWGSAAVPIEKGFYARVMRSGEDISPENAVPKLGQALLDEGKNEEALKVLNRAVAFNPRNPLALDLLRNALVSADDGSLEASISALRQAAFANPENKSLVVLLAKTIARTGAVEDAAKVLAAAVEKSGIKNSASASDLQVAVGDIYADSRQVNKAIAAYEKALQIRGVEKKTLVAAANKEFALRVFNKMIRTLKRANRIDEAKLLIEDSRPMFGKDSPDLSKEHINLLLETGKEFEALKAVIAARKNVPKDISLLRSEASILVRLGKVEKGVSLITNLIEDKPKNALPSMLYDDFSNYLFISSLYSEAKRKQRAVSALTKAFKIADGIEKKQIVKLNLAYVHSSFDDFATAERILREVLAQSPEYPLALNNLGYLLIGQNRNLEEALELIKRAVKIEPLNSSYLDSLGWAYFKLGRLDDAEDSLRKAFRLNSSSATILEHLGDVYKKRGKTSQAKLVWQKALNYTLKAKEVNRLRSKLGRE
ncbi:MAG: tetratricopeptide repeat protein [Pyrinomonadaceae bacterium]|nr:tetratricopeptide repeat protein [Pyrinomonadaceae bacterium]